MSTAAFKLDVPETTTLDWGVRITKAVPGISPGRGRGLFAVADIAPGEVIDRACTVYISSSQADVLNDMQPLGDFYFRHPANEDEGLMLLGLPSLCNHAEVPNAHIRFEDAGPCGWIAVLYALTPIREGEEITYRYRCPLWFAQAS